MALSSQGSKTINYINQENFVWRGNVIDITPLSLLMQDSLIKCECSYDFRILGGFHPRLCVLTETSNVRLHENETLTTLFLYCIVLYCILLCCIDDMVIAAQYTETFLRSTFYCAPPNLGITRTWICRLNFSQNPIFSSLRFFNDLHIYSQIRDPQLKAPPGGLVLRIFTSSKNPSTSAGFEPANLGSRYEHVTPRTARPTTFKSCL